MHAVVRGRVEHPFERAEARREFGVEEELIHQVDPSMPRMASGWKPITPADRKKRSRPYCRSIRAGPRR